MIKITIKTISNKANNAPVVIAAISASDKLFHAERIDHIFFIKKIQNISVIFFF